MSEPSDSARWKLNSTSSAVNGVPSWNCTPWRKSKRHTVGETCFQLVASAGARLRSLLRPVRPSYMLPSTESCSVSFSDIGSMDTASPWSATRSVCADATKLIAANAQAAPATSRFCLNFTKYSLGQERKVSGSGRGRGPHRHGLLHQAGMQRRAQRKNVVVEVVAAVVQEAAADTVLGALPDAQVGAGLDLQHEREVFRTHARLQVAHDMVVADQCRGDIGGEFGLVGRVDGGGVHALVLHAGGGAKAQRHRAAQVVQALLDHRL